MIKLLSNPITLFAFTILSIIFFLSLEKTGNKRLQSAETINQLEHEVASLETEVKDLAQEVEQASSSLNQEKIIRNELLLKKPGEYVVQLPDVEQTNEMKVTDTEQQQPAEAWIELLFNS